MQKSIKLSLSAELFAFFFIIDQDKVEVILL